MAAQDMADGHETATEDAAFAHGALARVVAASEPTPGLGIDDLVRASRSRVRRRRWSAAAGGVAVIAAISVGAAGFISHGPAPDPAATGTPAQRAAADDKLMYQAAERLVRDLDPHGTHIDLVNPLDADSSTTECYPDSHGFGYDGAARWHSKRVVPVTANLAPQVFISFSFTDPRRGPLNPPMTTETGWGPVTTTRLPDGSVVGSAARALNTPGQESIWVSRRLPDLRSLYIEITNGDPTAGNSRPIEPFPFTEQQVAKAAGDLALKFPFADGFELSDQC